MRTEAEYLREHARYLLHCGVPESVALKEVRAEADRLQQGGGMDTSGELERRADAFAEGRYRPRERLLSVVTTLALLWQGVVMAWWFLLPESRPAHPFMLAAAPGLLSIGAVVVLRMNQMGRQAQRLVARVLEAR